MKRALWLDALIFGVITDQGLFIYHSNISLSVPQCCITFIGSYNVKNVVYDYETIFILDEDGQIKKTDVKNSTLNSGNLETIHTACLALFKGIY